MQSKEKMEQISAMFNIAVTLQAVGFVDEEATDEIGQHLDSERINVILARKERHDQQWGIQNARVLLKNFLESTYLRTLEEFTQCGEGILNYVKYSKGKLLGLLPLMPNYKDAFMDTPIDAARWNESNDECQLYMMDVLKGKNWLGKIFVQKSTIENIEDDANYLKFVGIANAVLEMANGLRKQGPELLEDVSNFLNKIRIKIGGVTLDGALEVKELTDKFDEHNYPLSTATKEMLGINKKSIHAFNSSNFNYLKGREKWMKVKQLSFTRKFEEALLKSDKLRKLADFNGGTLWTKLIRNVGVFNLFFAGLEMRKSGSDYEFGLVGLKVATTLGDVYAAHRNVRQLYMEALKMDKQIIDAFEGVTKKYMGIVQYAGILIDTAEAGLAYWERDYDAAAAFGGSALLTGLSIFAFANGWNPVGWIAGIVALCVGFYAFYLKDGPLERYAKNCIFGEIPESIGIGWLSLTTPDVSFKGNYIQQINQHVDPKNRNLLLEDGFLGLSFSFKEWSDYRKGLSALMDILFSGRVSLKENKTQTKDIESIYSNVHTQNITIIEEVLSISAEIIFGTYIHEVEQLEHFVYFCPEGLGGKYMLMKFEDNERKLWLEHKKETPTKACINFKLPYRYRKLATIHAEIVLMCRLNVGNEQYFPMENNGQARYVASKLGIFLRDIYGHVVHEEKYNTLNIGTKYKLLNYNK